MTSLAPALMAEPDWSQERVRWKTYFNSLVSKQLKWITTYVEAQRKQNPAALKPRFQSLLALLNSVQERPALYSLALDLIGALHPLPFWWGKWTEWEPALRQAIKMAAALGYQGKQAEFLGYLAELQLAAGLGYLALETGKQGVELVQHGQDVPTLIRTGVILVTALRTAGQLQEARAFTQDLTAQLTQTAAFIPVTVQIELSTRLDFHQAYFLRQAGHLEQALAWMDRTLHRGRDRLHGFPELWAGIHKERATMFWVCNDYPAAVEDLKQAIRLYDEMGNPFASAGAWGDLGLVYWSMAELELAEKCLLFSIAATESLNARRRLTVDVGNLGLVCFSRGELGLALHYLEHQISLAMQTNYVTELSRGTGNRGMVKVYEGDYSQAVLGDIQQAISFIEPRSKVGLGHAYVTLSWFYLGREQRMEGERYAQKALSLAHEIDSRGLEIIALRCVAEFQMGTEKIHTLQRALEFARVYTRNLDEAGCLLSLAGCIDRRERETFWQAGVEVLQRIGATGWLVGHAPENPPRIALLL